MWSIIIWKKKSKLAPDGENVIGTEWSISEVVEIIIIAFFTKMLNIIKRDTGSSLAKLGVTHINPILHCQHDHEARNSSSLQLCGKLSSSCLIRRGTDGKASHAYCRGRNLSTPSSVRNARIMQVSNLGKAFRLVGRPGFLIWPPMIGALTWSYPAQVESKHPHPLMPPGKRAGKQHEKLKRVQSCLLLNTPTSHHADFHLRIWSYIQWAVEWVPVLLFYIFIGYSCSWNLVGSAVLYHSYYCDMTASTNRKEGDINVPSYSRVPMPQTGVPSSWLWHPENNFSAFDIGGVIAPLLIPFNLTFTRAVVKKEGWISGRWIHDKLWQQSNLISIHSGYTIISSSWLP